MANPALTAYRVLLRTIGTVFYDDARTCIVGRQQARAYFEKYRAIDDPQKRQYLIKEAYEARDSLYRDIMKLDYNPQKKVFQATVEKRHLKFDGGDPVYAVPENGRGLGARNADPSVKFAHNKIKLSHQKKRDAPVVV